MLQKWHCRLQEGRFMTGGALKSRSKEFSCLLQEALYFYRKHPVEPLDEPNPISKVNLMVGICWLGLQALVCPSLAFLHHFFPPPCASHCASTGTSCRNCGKLDMDFKKWFGEHGSFLKGSKVLMQSSNSSSIISIPASQSKFIFSYHANTCKVPWSKNT